MRTASRFPAPTDPVASHSLPGRAPGGSPGGT